MFSTIVTLLTSGAGGGIVGGILALFRTAGERKERLELEKLSVQRDQMEIEDRRATERHDLAMLEKGAEVKIQQAQAEGEIAADIENTRQRGMAAAAEFTGLKTTSGMDNFRAAIRPALASIFTVFFICVFLWAFAQYREQLTASDGKEILLGLFATLEFAVTSIISFYYVSRRNAKPQL